MVEFADPDEAAGWIGKSSEEEETLITLSSPGTPTCHCALSLELFLRI